MGAHVRDAAAYVCWAFARAYEREAMAEAAAQLAPALLAVACYDREVRSLLISCILDAQGLVNVATSGVHQR